jgi:hypothetical protein
MKAKRILKTSSIGEPPRIVGGRSKKPAKIAKVRTFNSFGTTETHLVNVIDLESNNPIRLSCESARESHRHSDSTAEAIRAASF